MKKDLIQEAIDRVDEIKGCIVCERQLANISMITKNGCLWCDSEYHLKENKNG